MPERIQETREQVISEEPAQEEVRRPVTTTATDKVDNNTTAARVIWFIVGVLLTLMAFRVVLSLLGANRANPFADLIYGITYPFVAPFFGLFGYTVNYGVSRFEVETLVAMAVYALIGYAIVKLMTINRRNPEV